MPKISKKVLFLGIIGIIYLSTIIGFVAVNRQQLTIPGLIVTFEERTIHSTPNQPIILECTVNRTDVDSDLQIGYGIMVNATVMANVSVSECSQPIITMKAYLYPTEINMGETIEVEFRFIGWKDDVMQVESVYVIIDG